MAMRASGDQRHAVNGPHRIDALLGEGEAEIAGNA
jgi:hypothetical protein